MYSGYGIAFDSNGDWNFGKEFVRNGLIFGVSNSSSSHTDNCKNNCLILGEGDTLPINESFAAPKNI